MRANLIASLFLIVLTLIFVAQNTDVVRVGFLFWATQLSLALLIVLLLFIGLVVGWLLRSYYSHLRRRRPPRVTR